MTRGIASRPLRPFRMGDWTLAAIHPLLPLALTLSRNPRPNPSRSPSPNQGPFPNGTLNPRLILILSLA